MPAALHQQTKERLSRKSLQLLFVIEKLLLLPNYDSNMKVIFLKDIYILKYWPVN